MLCFLAFLVTSALAGPYDALVATKASTAADEYRMGQEYIEGRRWLLGTWDEPAQQLRVEGIVRRILAHSDRPDQVFNVLLIQDKTLNAAALPGGFLMVHRGLLEALDDDELAFVIGHELSHVMLRHAANRLNVQTATLSVTELQRARGAQDKATAVLKSDELYLMMMGHSRQLELEADLYGLLYAVRAGYPAAAASAAMKKLQASVPARSGVYAQAYSSHPEFDERLDQLTKGGAGLRATAAEFDAGLRWLAAGRPDRAASSFQRFLTIFPESRAGWANLAVAELMQDGASKTDPYEEILPLHAESGVVVRDAGAVRRERARDALAHAFKLDEHDPLTLGLLGALARREGFLADARRYFEEAVLIAPEQASLHLGLGNVAAAEDKLPEAMRAWAKAAELAPGAPEPRVNLARVYTTRKQKQKALELWTPLADNGTWGAEARAAIASFDKKKVKKKLAPVKGADEAILVAGVPVRPGDPVQTLDALGPPDVDVGDDSSIRPMRYRLWDEAGLSVLIEGDTLVSLELMAPTTLSTRSGWALPLAGEVLTTALGPPDQASTQGSHGRRIWAAAGISSTEMDGEVWAIELSRPHPQADAAGASP